jgi:hypothetical protein
MKQKKRKKGTISSAQVTGESHEKEKQNGLWA